MTMVMTLKKYREAYRTAGTLPLLLLIVSMLTVPVMLFSAPLAAADIVADCEKSGGKYVVKNGQGHCFVTIEPDCHKLPPGEVVPDPELCLKPGGIANNPIFNGNDIADTVEDTLDEVMPVITDGDDISEAVVDSLNGLIRVVSDSND